MRSSQEYKALLAKINIEKSKDLLKIELSGLNWKVEALLFYTFLLGISVINIHFQHQGLNSLIASC